MNKPYFTNWPWKVDNTGKGRNWTICNVGKSQIDGKDYEVTTDHVHASELDGDAKHDAHLIAKAPELWFSLQGLCEVLIARWNGLSDDEKKKVEQAKEILNAAVVE